MNQVSGYGTADGRMAFPLLSSSCLCVVTVINQVRARADFRPIALKELPAASPTGPVSKLVGDGTVDPSRPARNSKLGRRTRTQSLRFSLTQAKPAQAQSGSLSRLAHACSPTAARQLVDIIAGHSSCVAPSLLLAGLAMLQTPPGFN